MSRNPLILPVSRLPADVVEHVDGQIVFIDDGVRPMPEPPSKIPLASDGRNVTKQVAEYLVAKHLGFPDSGNLRLLAAARNALQKLLRKRAELAAEEADEFDQYLSGCLSLLRSARFHEATFDEASPDFLAVS
ncbi:MAG TPA: hypothetical protein VGH74_18350 [Planctomycetaceae bacterium]